VRYSTINNVVIKNDLVVQGNPRRHSIVFLGSFQVTIRFNSWACIIRPGSGLTSDPIRFLYSDIGDVLYEPFTLIITTAVTDSGIIETYTEERPVD